jgi:hypothetical protein
MFGRNKEEAASIKINETTPCAFSFSEACGSWTEEKCSVLVKELIEMPSFNLKLPGKSSAICNIIS